jgi:two-component system nitrogen regulation response regulator GlnG
VPLHVPALRDRRADIPALVQHFILASNEVKVFEPAAMKLIEECGWPGNIRELENFTRRLVALHAQDVIDAETVAGEMKRMANRPVDEAGFDGLLRGYFAEPLPGLHARVLRDLEKPLIEQTLALTNGNQVKAAEILGLNRNTLRTKIRELAIEVRRG